MKKVGTALGPATGPLGPWWSHLFKNRLRCLLSPLVVMPPCHPWLTPPVVTLTGEREKEENLIRPGIAPARLSRIRETPEAASLFDN
jgi:hypothetical protein